VLLSSINFFMFYVVYVNENGSLVEYFMFILSFRFTSNCQVTESI
jgi:hypothetical protein